MVRRIKIPDPSCGVSCQALTYRREFDSVLCELTREGSVDAEVWA